jgi:hypothetical protein
VFWSDDPATVTRDSNGVSTVTFSGAAHLNAGAKWDRPLGAVEAHFSEDYRDVQIQFSATVQPDFQTAEAALTYDGVTFAISYLPPAHNAEAALANAMAAYLARDWHQFYLASDSTLQADMSESEFTSGMLAMENSHGMLDDWELVGSLTYHGEPGQGAHFAAGWLAAHLDLAGARTLYVGKVALVQDQGAWKVFSLDPPIAAATVSSSPANGWGFLQETATATGSFVSGPGTAPAGSGSAQIALGSTGGGLYGTLAFAGTRLSDIKAINYSTYQPSANPGTVQTISLQFDMDYNLTDSSTAWQGRLVYEPYFTETVNKGQWQTWDPLQGKWWATGSPGNGTCPQSNPCTWSQVLAAFPNAGIRASVGGLEFKAGSGWPASWQGNVDAFVIVVGDEAKAFDFEP